MKQFVSLEKKQVEKDLPDYPVSIYDKPVWYYGGKFYTSKYRAMFAKAKAMIYAEHWNEWVKTDQKTDFRQWLSHYWRCYEPEGGYAYNDPAEWTMKIHARARQLMKEEDR